jgi:hypothetical protein
MYSQFGQSPYNKNVPLPHEDQPHFYPGGLPDLDSIGVVSNPGGLSPGERGYYCGFDTLSTAGHAPSVSAENVLICGWEGGLRVQRITRKNIDIIGSIEGLRGGVIGAKILPWTFRADPGSSGRPYIAIIVHGPVLGDENTLSSNASEVPSTEDQDADSDPAGQANIPPLETRDIVKKYQTTVEIYSLLTQKHVATIFRAPPVDVEFSPMGDLKIPPPTGDLRLDANGRFLIISSGVSGEVFVFSPFTRDQNIHELESIHCIGKFWTTVKQLQKKAPATASNGGDQVTTPDEADQFRGRPLLSVSHRWIALVPPAADTLFSMKGKAMLANEVPMPPGISTHVSPPKPSTNCQVDVPEPESFTSRMLREGAQRGIRAARWLSEQGMTVINNYWTPPSGNTPNGQYPHNQEHYTQSAFPPTHGIDQSPNSDNSPVQVAIYDLQRLLDNEGTKNKNSLSPIAVFEPPDGCNFLSFAPSGLVLLTVSKKGDQHYVWSLMKMQYPRSGINGDLSQHVRQISWRKRMTESNTVDIVWATPQGDRYAVLTDNGTVHAHEIPSSAFAWPLRRSRRKATARMNDHGNLDTSPPKTAIGVAIGAGNWLRSAAGAVRPRSLGNASTLSTNLMMTPAATANAGGKVVKAGFTQGVKLVANSANTLYHSADNKLHIANLLNGITPGTVRWMTGRDRGYLAIVVTGTVNIYSIKRTSIPQKGQPPILRAKISKKPTEFALHKIPDDQFAPAFRTAAEARFGNHSTEETAPTGKLSGYWILRAPTPAHNATQHQSQRRTDTWHALVEAETNPPYQPFHTDRRVTLMAYADPDPPPSPQSSPVKLDDSQDPENVMDSQARLDSAQAIWENEILAPWLLGEHHVDPSPFIEHWPVSAPEPWVFGREDNGPLQTRVFAQQPGRRHGEEGLLLGGSDDSEEDEVENRIHVVEGDEGEQVVVTTVVRSRRGEEEFFEDGCEVLDFADERV